MNKTFAEEWKLYKEGGSRPQFKGEPPRGEADFDAPVKAGEIRVFADMARPFVALVAEERGVAGWLIVPVSPFTVPASPREALEGERIYQLWNACIASRSFVARSWRVDEMDADVLAELRGRCAARGEFVPRAANSPRTESLPNTSASSSSRAETSFRLSTRRRRASSVSPGTKSSASPHVLPSSSESACS